MKDSATLKKNKNISENNQCWRCKWINLLNVESFEVDRTLYGWALNDVTILWRKGLLRKIVKCKIVIVKDACLLYGKQKAFKQKSLDK